MNRFGLKRISSSFSLFATLGTVFFLATLGPASARAHAPACEVVFDLTRVEQKGQEIILTFKRGAKSFAPADGLASRINRSSPRERLEWHQAVGSVYRKVPKKDPNPLASWHIGGRRLLDRALTLSERYDLQWEDARQQGIGAAAFYKSYLEKQQAFFGIDYSEAEIFRILSFLRSEIPRLNQEGYAKKLLLAGSFINGKASLTDSDIDLSVNDGRILREIPEWQRKINSILRESRPLANLTIEAHGEPAAFYGKINPFVFEISAEGVKLLIFPPARLQGSEDLRAADPLVAPVELS